MFNAELFKQTIAFKERVKFKLNAAKYFLKKLEQLEQSSGGLARAERDEVELNLDVFLYEVVGAFEAQLQEINVLFKLPLNENNVCTDSIIKKLPNSSQTRGKIARIHGDTNGWLWQLREYRNHSAHRSVINFDFVYEGEYRTPTVYLHKDPLDISKGRADESVIQYCQNSVKRMQQLIDEIYSLSAKDLRSSKP